MAGVLMITSKNKTKNLEKTKKYNKNINFYMNDIYP